VAAQQPAAPVSRWAHEALLAMRVQSSLAGSMGSDAGHVHVAAAGHDITLTGEVEKQSSIARAEAIARSVEGVGRVTNLITRFGAQIPPEAAKPAADSRLELAVKTRLIAGLGAAALKMDVAAEAGVITLSGAAGDDILRGRALRIASETEGVRQVRSQLLIPPETSTP
jgi:osmotically-inducible protein OsmY